MSTNDYEGIGNRIREYRRMAGLTADQLAAKIPGLSRSGLAKIEAGVRAVLPVELVLGIAWALKVPPAVIVFPLDEPGSEITLGADTLPMEHAYFWAVGPRNNEKGEWLEDPGAHGAAVMETVRMYESVTSEIAERWGENGEHAETDEDRNKYLEELRRQRHLRKSLYFMGRHVLRKNGDDDGDDQ